MRIFWFMYRRIIITIMTILVLGTAIVFSIYNYNQRSVSSIVSHRKAPETTDQTVVNWDAVTINQMENEVISALQCVAAQQVPTISIPQHDPILSEKAEHSLITLQNNLSLTPDEVFQSHEWWHLAAVFEAPQTATGCHWADLDLSSIDFTQFSQVGVAIIPPVGYAPANVLIVGRKSQ